MPAGQTPNVLVGRPVRLGAVAVALVVALIVATSPRGSAQTPTPPPHSAESVGVVGCSNTAEHVDGYRAASDLDQMPQVRLGGLAFDMWGDPSLRDFDSAWRKYDSGRPAGGYQGAWVQMCITSGTPDPNGLLSVVVDQIHQRDPDIPIYVSPINQFDEGHVCSRVGPDGFEVSSAVAEWGLTNLPVQAGPITGPIGPGTVSSGDNCHLNEEGVALVGDQLVAWFDLGGWQDGAQPPSGSGALAIPALAGWCIAVEPLVAVGILPTLAVCGPAERLRSGGEAPEVGPGEERGCDGLAEIGGTARAGGWGPTCGGGPTGVCSGGEAPKVGPGEERGCDGLAEIGGDVTAAVGLGPHVRRRADRRLFGRRSRPKSARENYSRAKYFPSVWDGAR